MLRSDLDLRDLLARLVLLEEQSMRHEAEITICWRTEARLSSIEARLSRLEGNVQAEQRPQKDEICESGAAGSVNAFKRSADAGDADPQFKYGSCVESGIGIAKNASEAVKYYKLSAD
jgi:TPR repeat protein